MKALPPSFGLPTDVDELVDALKFDNGGEFLSAAIDSVMELHSQLSWLRTAPIPVEEAVVVDSLCDACDAAAEFLNSVPSLMPMEGESQVQTR